MSPKNFLKSISRSLRPPIDDNALVPVSRFDCTPLLSGQNSLSLLFDTSPSLDEYMRRVREGCRQIVEQTRRDPWLAERFALSLWVLGNDSPGELLAEWADVLRFETPALTRSIHTPLCGATAQMLDHSIDRGESVTRDHAADQAMSVAVVVSDFMATDELEHRRRMEESLRRAQEAGVKLILLTVGTVDQTFAESIAQPSRPPIPLESIEDFTAFFKALGQSIRRCSVSVPGAPLQIEFQGRSLRMD